MRGKPKTFLYQRGEVPESVWALIRELGKEQLSSTEGLVEDLSKRERLAVFASPNQSEIAGISTYDIVKENFEGRDAVMIFSGNTWVHPDWRGRNLTTWFGLSTFLRVRLSYPFTPIYLFFGSSNYKSYLFISRNLKTYWPRRDRSTPEWESRYIQHLAQRVYNATICPETLVWKEGARRSFTQSDTGAGERAATDPDIQYYVSTNPGYVHGERLMCLAPLSLSNIVVGLWSILTRSVRRRKRRDPERGERAQKR